MSITKLARAERPGTFVRSKLWKLFIEVRAHILEAGTYQNRPRYMHVLALKP